MLSKMEATTHLPVILVRFLGPEWQEVYPVLSNGED